MTTAKRRPDELPAWPRLLPRDLAAAYLGISPGMMERLPVPTIRIGTRRLYDRLKLDNWVDTLSAAEQDHNPQSILERIAQCGT